MTDHQPHNLQDPYAQGLENHPDMAINQPDQPTGRHGSHAHEVDLNVVRRALHSEQVALAAASEASGTEGYLEAVKAWRKTLVALVTHVRPMLEQLEAER